MSRVVQEMMDGELVQLLQSRVERHVAEGQSSLDDTADVVDQLVPLIFGMMRQRKLKFFEDYSSQLSALAKGAVDEVGALTLSLY